MSTPTLVAILTGVVLVVVVVTRLLLARGAGGGSAWVGRGIANVHTGAGLVGVAGWSVFLAGAHELVGIVALFFLWLSALAGLVIAARWRPRGVTARSGSRWVAFAERLVPALIHLIVLLAVVYLTWAYLVAAV